MKKWVVPILSVLLVLTLVYLSGPFSFFKSAAINENRKSHRTEWVQDKGKAEKGEEVDSHWVDILKQLQEQLSAWLKSLNERIDSEDVSRIEVRFLEILRNVLEWVKEKVDSKLESLKGKSKKKGGLFQETRFGGPKNTFPVHQG